MWKAFFAFSLVFLAMVAHADEAEKWRALGPGASHEMIRLFSHVQKKTKQLEILQGLGALNEPEGVAFLKQEAKNDENKVARLTAIRALGRAQGVQAKDFVASFLKDPDPQTRFAAAETLKKMNDPAAQKILERYESHEKTKWIVERLNEPTRKKLTRHKPIY